MPVITNIGATCKFFVPNQETPAYSLGANIYFSKDQSYVLGLASNNIGVSNIYPVVYKGQWYSTASLGTTINKSLPASALPFTNLSPPQTSPMFAQEENNSVQYHFAVDVPIHCNIASAVDFGVVVNSQGGSSPTQYKQIQFIQLPSVTTKTSGNGLISDNYSTTTNGIPIVLVDPTSPNNGTPVPLDPGKTSTQPGYLQQDQTCLRYMILAGYMPNLDGNYKSKGVVITPGTGNFKASDTISIYNSTTFTASLLTSSGTTFVQFPIPNYGDWRDTQSSPLSSDSYEMDIRYIVNDPTYQKFFQLIYTDSNGIIHYLAYNPNSQSSVLGAGNSSGGIYDVIDLNSCVDQRGGAYDTYWCLDYDSNKRILPWSLSSSTTDYVGQRMFYLSNKSFPNQNLSVSGNTTGGFGGTPNASLYGISVPLGTASSNRINYSMNPIDVINYNNSSSSTSAVTTVTALRGLNKKLRFVDITCALSGTDPRSPSSTTITLNAVNVGGNVDYSPSKTSIPTWISNVNYYKGNIVKDYGGNYYLCYNNQPASSKSLVSSGYTQGGDPNDPYWILATGVNSNKFWYNTSAIQAFSTFKNTGNTPINSICYDDTNTLLYIKTTTSALTATSKNPSADTTTWTLLTFDATNGPYPVPVTPLGVNAILQNGSGIPFTYLTVSTTGDNTGFVPLDSSSPVVETIILNIDPLSFTTVNISNKKIPLMFSVANPTPTLNATNSPFITNFFTNFSIIYNPEQNVFTITYGGTTYTFYSTDYINCGLTATASTLSYPAGSWTPGVDSTSTPSSFQTCNSFTYQYLPVYSNVSFIGTPTTFNVSPITTPPGYIYSEPNYSPPIMPLQFTYNSNTYTAQFIPQNVIETSVTSDALQSIVLSSLPITLDATSSGPASSVIVSTSTTDPVLQFGNYNRFTMKINHFFKVSPSASGTNIASTNNGTFIWVIGPGTVNNLITYWVVYNNSGSLAFIKLNKSNYPEFRISTEAAPIDLIQTWIYNTFQQNSSTGLSNFDKYCWNMNTTMPSMDSSPASNEVYLSTMLLTTGVTYYLNYTVSASGIPTTMGLSTTTSPSSTIGYKLYCYYTSSGTNISEDVITTFQSSTGNISPGPPIWNSNISYAMGQTVSYNGFNWLYISSTPASSSTTPDIDPQHWVEWGSIGNWTQGMVYYPPTTALTSFVINPATYNASPSPGLTNPYFWAPPPDSSSNVPYNSNVVVNYTDFIYVCNTQTSASDQPPTTSITSPKPSTTTNTKWTRVTYPSTFGSPLANQPVLFSSKPTTINGRILPSGSTAVTSDSTGNNPGGGGGTLVSGAL